MAKKNKIKLLDIYVRVVSIIVLAIVEFGIALPKLISAESDELVIIGFIILFLSLPLYYLIMKPYINRLIKKTRS